MRILHAISKRILNAISKLSPHQGGPPNAGIEMARAIARRGHDVAIYTTNFNGASDLDVPLGEPVYMEGGEVRYFAVYLPRFWKTFLALGRPLAAGGGKFDLMHLHSLSMYHDHAGGWGGEVIELAVPICHRRFKRPCAA
jgi:hypothetical protein